MTQFPTDQATSSAEARTNVLNGSRVILPARQQLLDRLQEETGTFAGLERLTVCVAPTGYGKTRTIAHWLGDGSDENDRVRWVHCSRGSSEELWQHIRHELIALSDREPELSEDALTDVARLAESLTLPATLVLDDYQLASTPEIDLAIGQIASSSRNLTLVVIGRSVGLLNSTFTTARTRVRIIDTRDLALTLDEANQLAESLGIPLGERLHAAFVQTEGWPLAIRAALNLGSDSLYLNTPANEWNTTQNAVAAFDPVMNLSTFAVNYLELTSVQARKVLLAAAQLDAINFEQILEAFSMELDEANAAIQELLELGLLTAHHSVGDTEYRCHRAVRAPLEIYSARTSTWDQRRALYRGRAERITLVAPFTAFKMYCIAEDFEAAEIVLARNFTTLTDEVESCGRILRSIPENVQRLHPTFTAALIFLDTPRPSVTPSSLAQVSTLWLESLRQRLPEQSPAESDPIYLPLLCQAMVATRITGQIEASVALMRTLDSQIIQHHGSSESTDSHALLSPPTESSLRGSIPTYYRESAATALAAGDFAQARRILEKLRQHSEQRILAAWGGSAAASIPVTSEAKAGNRWKLAALSELAFTELLDGDMNRCAELLAEMDAAAAQSDEIAPGLAWVGGEVARAHLSDELFDRTLLEQAVARLTPIRDRIEQWPLLLLAETFSMRSERGAEWALAHFRTSISHSSTSVPIQPQNMWFDSLTTFQAMLCTVSGNLSEAERLLESSAVETPQIRLERARLSLFAGDDVDAVLITRRIADPEVSKRQRMDRCIIGATAAWSCGRTEDAFAALSHASEYLEAYNLPSSMQGVPYDLLQEVTAAAREAGVCDLTELVDAIPEKARCVRYERLTEMETQALLAISQHRNTNQAAAALFVTAGTVKKHLASVYRKLQVNGRDEAILQAGRMGLLG